MRQIQSRIVIKVGTKTISGKNGVDQNFLNDLAQDIKELISGGRQILLVSSGAIGMGSMTLKLTQKSQSIAMRQACASIGQPLLMQAYRNAFLDCGIVTAQILLTRDQFNNRRSFNNLKTTVEKLLKLGVVPIVNENDTVSTEEIGRSFGDNDQLSALVASKISADLLIILSDVDGLYDSDPRNNSEAHRMSYVKKLSSEHLKAAGGRGSRFSSGGMETKLKAVAIAGDAGCPVILAQGRSKQVLRRICGGEDIGTFFEAAQPLKNRQRWIKNADPQGSITVDAGALAAIMKKGSLLPSGVTDIHGVFTRGAVILVNNQIKLISSFDSNELEKILGRHSAEIRKILGKEGPEVIARPEDMVII